MTKPNNLLVEINEKLRGKIEKQNKYIEKIKHKLDSMISMDKEAIPLTLHEIKRPLNNIKCIVKLFRDLGTNFSNSKQRELLSDLEIANDQILHLINDLLNISKIDYFPYDETSKKVHNINNFSNKIFKTFKFILKQRNIKIINEIPDNITLRFDGSKINLVVSNLIDNAIKYSNDDSQIEIGIRSLTNTSIILFIRDHGIGISKDASKKIFKKFFRSSELSNKDIPGSGLGLYIVKKILDSQNCQIAFESEFNAGTTFLLTLPKT